MYNDNLVCKTGKVKIPLTSENENLVFHVLTEERFDEFVEHREKSWGCKKKITFINIKLFFIS